MQKCGKTAENCGKLQNCNKTAILYELYINTSELEKLKMQNRKLQSSKLKKKTIKKLQKTAKKTAKLKKNVSSEAAMRNAIS